MNKTLMHEKIAILVANGFNEAEMVTAQKLLQKQGAYTRLISMDHGLVNSWTGTAWGHHFAADCVLSTALAADFSMLLIPGGRRSVEKLKLTAHTQRFIGGFLNAGKPLALMGDAIELLLNNPNARGRAVCGAEFLEQGVKAAGMVWSDSSVVADDNLITCRTAPEDVLAEGAEAIVHHFATYRMQTMRPQALKAA
ncbi:MAG TPA: DJ-1/PfpI family protein, partial [Alphaproteobacteria bacterium]|nr:DJ-1/PfpI family protein [Alphaproteobacteria bacterium]